jgi:hypothetical protein
VMSSIYKALFARDSNRLLFLRDGGLFAQRFNPQTSHWREIQCRQVRSIYYVPVEGITGIPVRLLLLSYLRCGHNLSPAQLPGS